MDLNNRENLLRTTFAWIYARHITQLPHGEHQVAHLADDWADYTVLKIARQVLGIPVRPLVEEYFRSPSLFEWVRTILSDAALEQAAGAIVLAAGEGDKGLSVWIRELVRLVDWKNRKIRSEELPEHWRRHLRGFLSCPPCYAEDVYAKYLKVVREELERTVQSETTLLLAPGYGDVWVGAPGRCAPREGMQVQEFDRVAGICSVLGFASLPEVRRRRGLDSSKLPPSPVCLIPENIHLTADALVYSIETIGQGSLPPVLYERFRDDSGKTPVERADFARAWLEWYVLAHEIAHVQSESILTDLCREGKRAFLRQFRSREFLSYSNVELFADLLVARRAKEEVPGAAWLFLLIYLMKGELPKEANVKTIEPLLIRALLSAKPETYVDRLMDSIRDFIVREGSDGYSTWLGEQSSRARNESSEALNHHTTSIAE